MNSPHFDPDRSHSREQAAAEGAASPVRWPIATRVFPRLRMARWLGVLVFILGTAGAEAVSNVDTSGVLDEIQRAQEGQQLWMVPDVQKELKPDYFARLEKDAAAGNTKAQATLGLCYHGGYGVKRDFAKAAEWYAPAAKAGHAGAQNNLGSLYERGSGVPVDHAKAHELYLAAAQQGLADAQFNLGLDYARGITVAQDWQTARTWYEKAAAQGQREALTNLGNMYLFGHGVAVNPAQARKYLEQPAAAEIPVAQLALGLAYAAQNNFAAAAPWLRRAAENGNAVAQLFWSDYLYEGLGGQRDFVTSTYWARKAVAGLTQMGPKFAAPGHAQLAKLLLTQPSAANNVEAFREASLSAQAGNAEGENYLGMCYSRGAGAPKDPVTGFKWFLLAAQQNHAEAACCVGLGYEAGQHVAKDFAAAVKWFRVGAEGGSAMAQYQLGRCYRDGIGVDIDAHEALKWLRLAAPHMPNNRDNSDVKNALAQLQEQLNHTDSEAAYRRGAALAQAAQEKGGSMDEALQALNEAVNLGHPFATTALARMYRLGAGVPKDEERAEALIARIGQASNPVVLCQIGLSYLPMGHEAPLPKNADRAIGFLLRAVQQGYGPALGPLGFCYMTASPEQQDLVAAFEWLSLAAGQGDESARMYLERVRPRLTAAQTTEALRRLNEMTAGRGAPAPGGATAGATSQATVPGSAPISQAAR